MKLLGDYIAGPNHTLPTGGTAKFYSPLNVENFLKKSSIISFSKKAINDFGESCALLADTDWKIKVSKFKDWFTEDDDDIFFGSPKSKFFDILEQTHRDLVEDEIDKVIEKLAILELIISQDKDEDFDINSYLQDFKEKNEEDVNSMKKGLYMEFSGEIISRLDS